MNIKSKQIIKLIVGLGIFSVNAKAIASTTANLSLAYPSSYELSSEDCAVIEDQLDKLGSDSAALVIYKTAEEHIFNADMLDESILRPEFKSLKADFDWSRSALVNKAIRASIESNLKDDIRDSVLNHPGHLRLRVNSRLLLCDIMNSNLEISVRMSGEFSKKDLGPIKISKKNLLGLSKAVANYKEKIKTMGLEYSASNYEDRDLVAGAILGLELFKVSQQSIHNLEISDLHYLKTNFFNDLNFQPKAISDSKAMLMQQELRGEEISVQNFKEEFSFIGGQ